MAAPAFRSATVQTTYANATSRVLDKPAGVVENDILIFAVYTEADRTITWPTGFTQIIDQWQSSGGGVQLAVAWKRATSSEPATYTASWTTNAYTTALLAAYSGAITSGSPLDDVDVTSASGPTLTLPANTTTVADTLGIAIGTWYNWSGDPTTPAGWTNDAESINDSDDSSIIEFYSEVHAGTGSTGSETLTITSGSWVGAQLSLLPASSSIAGTLTATLPAATLSASGTLPLAGTLSSALGAAVLSAQAAIEIAGQLAGTLTHATLSASGELTTPGIEGELSATLDNAALSGAGQLDIAGELTTTLGAASLSAAGTVAIDGEAALNLDAAVLSGAGTLAVTGSLESTLGNASLSAAGSIAIDGSADATLSGVLLSGAGVLAIDGSLTGTLGDVTLEATGTSVSVTTGALSATLEAASLSAAGEITISGESAAALASATVSAAGVLLISGAVVASLEDAGLIAAGTVDITGAANVTLADASLSGAGTVAINGALTSTLANVTLAAAGGDMTSTEGGEATAGDSAYYTATLVDADYYTASLVDLDYYTAVLEDEST